MAPPCSDVEPKRSPKALSPKTRQQIALAGALALGHLAGCDDTPSPRAEVSHPAAQTDPKRGAREEVGPGRWRKLRDPGGLSAEQAEMAAQLEAIGCLSGSRVSEKKGVARYRKESAWSGLNFYTSGHGPKRS